MLASKESYGDSSNNGASKNAGATVEESSASADCPFCFGTGMEVVPGEGARRCRCQTPDHRDRLFNAARIPPRYEHCTIQGYMAADNKLSKWAAKMEDKIFIDDYMKHSMRGLLLCGSVSV